jgi:DNA-binding CsgD family transcriptional regulator
VLLSRPAVWPGGVADAAAALFGLTPAEARVFGLVAGGATPAEAAAALGVAPSTLKTHLLHVFDKVGVHRQSDLVQLGASLASPLAERDPTDTQGRSTRPNT